MLLRSVGALTLALAALAPSAAQAAPCTASTPVAQSFSDASRDSVDGAGQPDQLQYAPDIVAVDVSADAHCNLMIGARLGDHVSASTTLYDGELIAFFLDVDGNAGTGNGAGSDRAIVTTGSTFGPDTTRVGTWNGSAFDFQNAPAPAAPWGRQTLSFDALGITAPTTLGVFAFGMFEAFDGARFYDFAPEGETAFRVSLPPPPEPPPPPPPPPPPTPTPTPTTTPARGEIRFHLDHYWTYKGSLTRVGKLIVSRLEKDTRVVVRCLGTSCPFRTWSTSGRERIDLKPRFGRRRLRTGTRIEIRLTRSGLPEHLVTITTRSDAVPRVRL